MQNIRYTKNGLRRIAILLCLTMIFTSIPTYAFAQTSEEPDAGNSNVQCEEQTLENTLILDENPLRRKCRSG
ncbi:MAG: hypothetical protein PUB87_06335 [Eubacteriaceae bacterium]|nr:hypothetical protein [Eubacteriaceae bacterium]